MQDVAGKVVIDAFSVPVKKDCAHVSSNPLARRRERGTAGDPAAVSPRQR
jgi:hypothetical protein